MATVLDQDRQKWLEERRQGLGGSDIGKIVGVSKWGDGVDVWMDKKGMSEPQPENMSMKLGTALEPFVADQFMEMTGKKVIEYRPTIHGTGEHAFALGNLDRIVVEDGQNIDEMVMRLQQGDLTCVEAILECKTSSNREAWVDEETGEPRVPTYYAFQVMHYMGLVPTCRRVYVCVVFLDGRKDRELYVIERDQGKIDRLFAIEKAWWEKHIINGFMPEAKTLRDVTTLYPKSDPTKVFNLKDSMENAATAEEKADFEKVSQCCRDLAAKLAAIKKETEDADRMKDFITSHMQDCETLVDTDGSTVLATFKSGKATTRDVVDWEAVAKEANVSPDIITAHTEKGKVVRKASRPFLLKQRKSA